MKKLCCILLILAIALPTYAVDSVSIQTMFQNAPEETAQTGTDVITVRGGAIRRLPLEDIGVGPQGPAGPAGSNGSPGATGPAGPQGLQGPAGEAPNYRGTWAGAPTGYVKGDVVEYAGSSYLALAYSSAVAPGTDAAKWVIFAAKGNTGATGATGSVGAKGDKGDTGLQGIQGVAGPAGAAGVKGDTGLTGATGSQGPIGATGPKGDKGDQGDVGATGPADTTTRALFDIYTGAQLDLNASQDATIATKANTSSLGSAAYANMTSLATAEQGELADSALQAVNVVDSLTSTDAAAPLSAKQGKALQDNKLAKSGTDKLTLGTAPTNTVGWPNVAGGNLQSIGDGTAAAPSTGRLASFHVEKYAGNSGTVGDVGAGYFKAIHTAQSQSHLSALTAHVIKDGGGFGGDDSVALHVAAWSSVPLSPSGNGTGNGSLYGIWSGASNGALGGTGHFTAAEFDINETKIDSGHFDERIADVSTGVWVASQGFYPVTSALHITKADQKYHTGLYLATDAIMPSTAQNRNEAVLLKGASASGNAAEGIRYEGHHRHGINTSAATFTAAPILIGKDQAIKNINQALNAESNLIGTSGSDDIKLGTATSNILVGGSTASGVIIAGTVVAPAFKGDGSLLTNLPNGSAATVQTNLDTHAGATDPHAGYMLESNIGTGASQYPAMDASGNLALGNWSIAPAGAITATGSKSIKRIATALAAGQTVTWGSVRTHGNNIYICSNAGGTTATGSEPVHVVANATGADGIKWCHHVTGTSIDYAGMYQDALEIRVPLRLYSQNTSSYISLLSGLNSPEGVVAAVPGSLYINISGPATTMLYYKVAGTGNTGWASASANALALNGKTFANPGPIGTTPDTINGTTITATGTITAKQFTETAYTPAAGSHTVSLANGTDVEVVTSGLTTITLPTPADGQSFTLTVKHTSTDAISFAGATIKWANGILPTNTTTAGALDIYVCKAQKGVAAWLCADGGRGYATP